MRKFLSLIFGLVVFDASLQAQSTITNMGFVSVDSGTTIVTESSIEDSGIIANHKNSVWHFAGTAAQQKINSTAILKFGSLYIDNPFNLSLNNHLTIDSQCNFINGKFLLNNYNCTLQTNASLAGYNTNNYFVTNGFGQLIQSSPASQTITYPVGTMDDYLPFTLTNKGSADVYSIRTQDSSYLKYDSSKGIGKNKAVQTLAVNKTWIVNEQTPGGADFDVNLQWNGTEELPAFNRNQAEIRYYDYSDSSWKTASNYVAASGSNPYSITKNINGLSNLKNFPLGVFTIGAPLPVEWLSFDARKNNNDVILNWKTTNSIRNSHFVVQRSTNTVDFISMATIKANTVQTYQYNDMAAFESSNANVLYYRFKQVDLDGRFSYSKIVSLKNQASSIISVSPNPVIANIQVSYVANTNETITIAIVRNNGTFTYNKKFNATKGDNIFLINIEEQAAGIYYLTLTNSEGKRYTEKIVKRN